VDIVSKEKSKNRHSYCSCLKAHLLICPEFHATTKCSKQGICKLRHVDLKSLNTLIMVPKETAASADGDLQVFD
jgi:hypothetical protein